MISVELKIQRLSMALEALSRINGYDAHMRFEEVNRLLVQAINEAEQLVVVEPTPERLTDDDIPF